MSLKAAFRAFDVEVPPLSHRLVVPTIDVDRVGHWEHQSRPAASHCQSGRGQDDDGRITKSGFKRVLSDTDVHKGWSVAARVTGRAV